MFSDPFSWHIANQELPAVSKPLSILKDDYITMSWCRARMSFTNAISAF